MATLFAICSVLILTHYLLFPLSIALLSCVFRRPVSKKSLTPPVTLIIAAYNEEAVIEYKLENVEALDYPKELLEVIVVSDGSTDQTAELVRKFQGGRMISLFSPERRGKTDALNRAVAQASNEILVFSDANNLYQPDAVRRLVSNFADAAVGAVSGQKRIIEKAERESSKGDATYWSFESRLKQRESLLGSISTLDGEICAVRKNLYRPLRSEVINDDMALTLEVARAGFRVVYEPSAISEEVASIRLEEDARVKARMVAGGYQIFSLYAGVLLTMPLFSLQLIMHKGLRYIMPFLLLGLLVSSIVFPPFFLVQVAFYASAALGWLFRNRRSNIFYLPLYYCVMNGAAVLGFWYFLRRKALTAVWKKAAR